MYKGLATGRKVEHSHRHREKPAEQQGPDLPRLTEQVTSRPMDVMKTGILEARCNLPASLLPSASNEHGPE